MKKEKIYPGISRLAGFAIVLMLLGPLQGCMFYYKVQTEPLVRQQEIKKYDSLDKYMILHQRDRAWRFSQPLILGNVVTGKPTAEALVPCWWQGLLAALRSLYLWGT